MRLTMIQMTQMIAASPNNPANPPPECDLELLMPASYAHPPTETGKSGCALMLSK